jgi:hypothetical protein
MYFRRTCNSLRHENIRRLPGRRRTVELLRAIRGSAWNFYAATAFSELSIHNKLTLYKQVVRPVWSYGIQLCGCASDSNIKVIQRYQNKVLKCIVNAPWYVRNSDHRDLGIDTVTDIIAKFIKSHEKRLQGHINIEASRLLNVNNITRRLKRKKLFELVKR